MSKVKPKKKSRNNREELWPRRAKYWMAVGTLAACSAAGGRTSEFAFAQAPAQAQTQASHGQAPYTKDHSVPVRRFDIAPGSLGTVMDTFSDLTKVRISIPAEGIRDLSSPGVAGFYTEDQALQRLLAGTKVVYDHAGPGLIRLRLATRAETIDVTEAAPQVASPKYTEPLRDTPQTITILSRDLIEEQGATNLRDVLRNVPGLTVAAGEGGTPAGDNLTLRGFSARNALFVDGVRDLSPQARDPFDLEQVEVVKGPNAAVSGRGSTAGSVNLVSKTPALGRFLGGGLNFASDGTKRLTSDVNLPLAPLGQHTALRLNLLYHEGGVAGRDAIESRRWGAAPSIAFGIGGSNRLTLSYYKLQQNNISDYGIPWVRADNNVLVDYRDRPAPVPRETFYGYRDRDRERLNSDLATLQYEHDFSDGVTFHNQFRYGHSTRDSIATPPRFASPDSTVINREMRSWIADDDIWDNQADVSARFSTAGIQHTLITGVELTREGNIRRLRSAPNGQTTLLNPDPDDVYTGEITTSPLVGDLTGNTQAAYAFDTVQLGRHWEAMGGLRWERFDAEGMNISRSDLIPVSRVDSMPSLRAGLTYKPRESSSVYFSYGTSMDPSLEGLSYQSADDTLEPEKTYSLELGSKWETMQGRLLLSGALFQVEKTNARTPGVDPGDPATVLEGLQRVQGMELGATGNITRRWKVFGAYTLMDSRVVDSNNPDELGKRIQNAPRNSFNIWTTYRLWKLEVGGGPRYVGRRFGNSTNSREVPGYWTMDGVVSYALTSRMDLRLNVYNLNNAYYFDRLGGGHVVPGPARSVMVGTGFRF